MKLKTKHRVIIACLGGVLSVLATFIGAGLTGWAFHVHQYGMRAPEMFGWIGAFILFGFIALIAVAPALLTILGCGIVWCTPLRRHALLSAIAPLFLGGVAIALCILTNPKDIALSGFLVAGTSCLAITVVTEFKLRTLFRHDQAAISTDIRRGIRSWSYLCLLNHLMPQRPR